jgi:hypothetical protein
MSYGFLDKIMALIAVLAVCILLAVTLLSGRAAAQSAAADDTTKLADQIIDCAGLSENAERLRCYDELAEPLVGIEEPTADGSGQALHSFTGKDDWDSEVLEVDKPWRLVWQNQGSLLTVELRSEQGELIDVIGNQIGKGGGRSESLDPGSYTLAVRGLGGWRVQVVSEARR